jgi:hypothetical protein
MEEISSERDSSFHMTDLCGGCVLLKPKGRYHTLTRRNTRRV